ncbi:hypothetical protein A3I34_01895 [Candidatus Jorgensenbacteria bacterium RIFCSPLOWO2_02_FULL_45_12]|uniref:Aminoacyl-tRNA hydrolase n=2 Tax=Candidatus Joergenseniibacteriota TaxID=1752739 RepID=A0A1F6BN14_9BACT|nr:MAG: Peptidyl-tRNA hydrolase [Candidatus Jorgensenbacteria bacterium GW2011_GWA2_45_9]OGG38233.1 MAG: hypothetical protein A3D55_01655 [Candidatus Jorgensenbacteria bacterium RIFCSPHIGHO2_02_FULL_45_20]OGG42250.1 MAG: hypothetical protein A3I34_01895 [Candidatus Jorgensenbacteria bacterium RIFCSPLOWO2_02_FULL_45_12]
MLAEFNSSSSSISIIIGIGNPGDEYEWTFHNAGVEFARFVAREMGGRIKFKKHSSRLFSYTSVRELRICESASFMNNSGATVGKAVSFFKKLPENILVAHDDSDIALGNYKLDFGAGSAGHNGIASVIASLKTKNFWRARIGTRNSRERGRKKAGSFVLSKVSDSDKKILLGVFKKIMDDCVG